LLYIIVVIRGELAACISEPMLVRTTKAEWLGMIAARAYMQLAIPKRHDIACDGARASRRVKYRIIGVIRRPHW
jgi:hypothetical protein